MRTVLKASLAVGFVGIIVAAPNSLQAIEFFINQYEKNKKRNPRFKEQFKRSGYFDVKKIDDNKFAISMTQKGRTVANNILFEDYSIARQLKWDGKWYLLIFDVEEKDRGFRDAMRRKISDIGMLQLQNSVYIYPYSIDEFVVRLKAAYPIESKKVIAVAADRISSNHLEATFKKAKLI